MLKVEVLITQEPNELLDEHHITEFLDIIAWNLIKLAYLVFIQKFGSKSLNHFDCPTDISPLLFSQLFVFHHNKAGGIQADSVTINTIGQQQPSKKAQQFSINEDGLLCKVWIGNTSQPICMPGNFALTIPGILGKNTKTPRGTSCLVDTAAVQKKLAQGISDDHSLAHPKGNEVPVVVINQSNYNIWI